MIEPGLYTDLSNEDYHADDAISSTDIKNWQKHPNIYYHYRKNPEKKTDWFYLGELVHTIVLETDRFYKDYAVLPEDLKLNTKKGQKKFEEWRAIHPNSNAVRPKLWDTVHQIKAAVEGSTAATVYLENTRREHSIFWSDRSTGLPCKCRMDAEGERGNIGNYIIDIKTCHEGKAHEDLFPNEIRKFKYDIQAAMYTHGYCQYYKLNKCTFIFIAVETVPPFMIQLFKMPESWIFHGLIKIEKALQEMKEHREQNTNIHGYSNKVTEIEIPYFVQKEMELYT